MLVWNCVFCDSDSDCSESHAVLTGIIEMLPQLSTVFRGLGKIWYRRCPLTVLYFCEFCENWCFYRCS